MQMVEMVGALRSTTSRKEKIRILKSAESDLVPKLLQETFDPNLLHHVKLRKSDIPKEEGFCRLEDIEYDIRDLLDKIGSNNSNQQNRQEVVKTMKLLPREDQEILFAVINKSLKVGVNIQTINEAMPGLIQVEPIQLANKYDPNKKYPTDFWEVSYKLDGMRVFAFQYHDKWFFYSRGKNYLGRQINTLEHWQEELMELYKEHGWTYLEGEAYVHGWPFERIQGAVMSAVNYKSDAKALQFHVFVAGKRKGKSPSQTTDVVSPTSRDMIFKTPSVYAGDGLIRITRLHLIPNNKGHIYDYLNHAVSEGFEGIMLRDPNNLLVCKRSNHLLKVKRSDAGGSIMQADCLVTDILYDDFTVMENGEVTTEYLPTKLEVEQEDGTSCLVGSGFTIDFRRALNKDPQILLGKTVEVEFQGFGSSGRMRFPVYRRVREDL